MIIKLDAPSKLVLASHIFDLRWGRLDLPEGSNCIVDMSGCTYGEPQGMLLFAISCRRLRLRNPTVTFKVRSSNSDFRGYASHVGLFRYMGFDLGNAPNAATGSSTYTPIRLFDIEQLRKDAGDQPVGKYLTRYSAELAKVFCQQGEGRVYDLFEYCFREVMRNSVEHSKGRSLAVFGQQWPAKGEAEIVIYDDGVGVAETLYDNEYINCSNGREALKFALLPGISGVSLDERFRQDENWGNSGFGLYVTSRFCAEFGSFRIISGQDALTFSRGLQTEHKWDIPGTFVQMRFKVGPASERASKIDEIVDQGKREARELLANYPIQPSVASTLLASHFEKRNF